MQGGTHRTRCLHKAVRTTSGLWPPQESCYLRGHRQGGTHRRRYTRKAVRTTGGLWPPQESCYLRGHMQGGAHRKRCLHNTVHTKGGLWPPQESCYLRGHRQGGAHRTRCLHKAVHTTGGLWPRQESCALEGLRRGLCFLKRHIGWGGYRNEPALWPANLAGRTAARRFGRPNHRAVVLAEFSAKILGGGLGRSFSAGRTAARWFGRPNHGRVFRPRTTAEPHHRFIPMSYCGQLSMSGEAEAEG